MHVSRRPHSTSSLPASPLAPHSPVPSPTKTPTHRYSDRFIPSRSGSGDLHAAFDLLRRTPPQPSHPAAASLSENSATVGNVPGAAAAVAAAAAAAANATASPPPAVATGTHLAGTLPAAATAAPWSQAQNCYSLLLKSELLDAPPPAPALPLAAAVAPAAARAPAAFALKRPSSLRAAAPHPGLDGLQRLAALPPTTAAAAAAASATSPTGLSAAPARNLLRFREHRPSSLPPPQAALAAAEAPFGVGAVDARNALLLSAAAVPGRISRKISRTPFKVLDAPMLKDDFYLNLVDWSAANVLAVGLGSCVYLWSACTSVVTKLCDLQLGGPVCSVAWNQQGGQLAVGTQPGYVQVWDAETCKLLRTLSGHTARAGCLAWNASLLSSGGRDKEIFNRDLRTKEAYIAQLSGHKQEVCGLKWSHDDMQLASGGNDNKLLIWNGVGLGSGGNVTRSGSGVAYNSPVIRFSYHDAAVKAIAWSPHARGLLASGGGTVDRKMRFWNTMTNSALAAVDTGSQVCNLAWSKNVNELVSTHGYSQNQIIVWKYPKLSKVVTLMGHSFRVLYLAVSPSGETIVTGAGDETLRFWNVFPSARSSRGNCDNASKLSPGRMSIR